MCASRKSAEGRAETTVVMCSWRIARLLFCATILHLRLADEITTQILHVYIYFFFAFFFMQAKLAHSSITERLCVSMGDDGAEDNAR